MVNNHTKTPWAKRNLEIIGPYGSHKHICEMTGNFMDEEEKKANCYHILKCVNNYEILVKALQACSQYKYLTINDHLNEIIETALKQVNEFQY